MNEHCSYVWENFISTKAQNENKCAASKLAIFAHSAGGRCIAHMFDKYKAELLQRTQALLLIDAYYHAMFKQTWTQQQLKQIKTIGIHFKNNKNQLGAQLGTKLKAQNGSITEISAGIAEHCKTCPMAG